MKPKIALLTRINDQKYTVNLEYVKALKNAGAEIVLLHPQSLESLEKELERCNGLCIPGGDDVDPIRYNEENTFSKPNDESIDQLDLDCIQIMVKQNKPILGICRGLQILNVAFGGTLYQDINLQVKTSTNHNYSFINQKPLNGHIIKVVENTELSKLLQNNIEVNTYHHQSIKDLAVNFKISAYSEDGIIEAIETDNILAVQWHPERMTSLNEFQNIFNYFVEKCKNINF